MKKLWIVLANSKMTMFYSVSEKDLRFNLVKTLFHPESALKNQDLCSDRPGHYIKGNSQTRGSYADKTEKKEHEIECFSKKICEELERERNTHAYDGLIIIAEPHFYGLIHSNLNHSTKALLKHHLTKDYTHLTAKKLKETLDEVVAHELRLLMLIE
jgi:protein required for attachment to host cells